MPKNIAKQRRYWIGIVALGLALLLLISYVPTWAAPSTAPHNQTVPIPTPKPDPTQIPTATPHNDDDDRDDDDDEDRDDGSDEDTEDLLPDPNGTPEPETPEGDIAIDTGTVDEGLVAPFFDPLLTGEVVVVTLNARSGPGTEFDAIGAFSSGDSVQLMARNEAGTWWVICCVGEAGASGWVSAQFIKPAGSRAEIGSALPVVQDLDELAAMIAAADAAAEIAEAAPEIVAEKPAASELTLAAVQSPPYASQGDSVELRFTVTNIGEEDATNISIRDQLTDELTYISATADGDGRVDQSDNGDFVILHIDWPQLSAGESVDAIVSVKIASDLPSGAVIDNLVAVDADNASSVTSAVSIGMAPIALPDF